MFVENIAVRRVVETLVSELCQVGTILGREYGKIVTGLQFRDHERGIK
jgi:hypothetical protein